MSHDMTRDELLLHMHEHLREIGREQAAQSEQLQQIRQQLAAKGLILRRIFRKVGKIMGTLDTLEAAVTRVEGIGPSVIKLLGDLSDEIRQINNSAAAQVLADRVNSQADALAAAVEANPDPTPNTPPVEPPVEEPPVEEPPVEEPPVENDPNAFGGRRRS